mgnify:FL=1
MKNYFINQENELRIVWKILLCIVLAVAMIIAFGITKEIIGFKDRIGIVSTLAVVVAIYIMLKVVDKKGFRYIGFEPISKGYSKFLVGMLLGGFLIVVNVIVLRLSGLISFETGLLAPNLSLDLLEGLLILAGVSLAEEMVFRGYIQKTIQRTDKNWLAILISALLWTLIHAGNANYAFLPFLNILLAGILLGYLVVKTRSIYIAIGLHITWNYFQGYIFGIQVSGRVQEGTMYLVEMKNNFFTGGNFGLEGGLANTLVLIAAILLSSLYYRNKSQKIDNKVRTV